jgi:L-ascorbate metabolism protein UlaG (beta-lactamase superfamily)
MAMHLAIAIVSTNHPDYLDPNVIIGGLMSHIFFAVPLSLVVKWRLA